VAITLLDRIAEIRDDPFETDILDLEPILLEVGYEYSEYPSGPEETPHTRLYAHPRWGILTFPFGTRTLPVQRLLGIIDMLLENLTREGAL
jgi:hypothetical protein